jgi:hypothetical protein
MAAGVLNPLNNAKSVATRPATVLTGDNERRWFSDELDTIVKAQDLNAMLGQIRHAMDFYSIADVEGSDTGLRQSIQAGAASLSGNLLRFQALVGAADKVPYFTSAAGMTMFTATSYSRGLLALTNQFQWADALGISASSSDNVVAFGALASAADTIGYFTGVGSMAVTGFTAFIRTLLDDTSASVARTTLGLGSASTHPDTDFAPIASPALTGVPTAPTAGPGANTTQLATTAFVQAALPILAAIATSGSASDLAAGTVPSARLPASLASIYGLTPVADRVPYYTGASTAALATLTAFARTILDDPDDVTVRATLGLAAVASTGSAADLVGTLGSARLPASLSSIYTLTPAADRFPYYTAASTAALAILTAFARTLLDDADAPTMRTTLGLVAVASSGSATDLTIGTLASARLPASLSSIYALTPAADRLPYYTAAATAALATFTAFARTLLDDADAPTMRTTLGLVAVASSGSAADLSTGTLLAARLPASLSSIYALTPAADRLPYYTSASVAALSVLTAYARTLLDDADAPTARATLGAANIAGDNFTGAVSVDGTITASGGAITVDRTGDATAAQFILNSDSGQSNNISGQSAGLLRWQALFGDTTAESGSNVGSDFSISRYSDTGVLLATVLTIARSTGVVSFTTTPIAPTVGAGDNSTKIATTAFVATSFAPLASPALTGVPTAPTPTAGDNSTKIATTAFVAAGFAPLASPTFSGTLIAAALTVNDGHLGIDRVGDASAALLRMYSDTGTQTGFEMRTGATTLRWKFGKLGDTEAGGNAGSNFFINSYDDAGVLINQSLFIERATGIVTFAVSPTAPTPTAGDNTTKLATTGFVVTSFAPLSSPALTGTPTSTTPAPGDNTTKIATTAFVVASFAPLASPALTGIPTAPTPAGTDSTTKIATTAFVATNFAKLTGATFTGQVLVSTVGAGIDSNLFIQSDAGRSRVLYYRTGTSIRWALFANNVAEAGSNAGSDFTVNAYDDAGVSLGNIFIATRATRILSFGVSPLAPTPTAGDATTKVATTAFVNTSFAKLSGATFTGQLGIDLRTAGTAASLFLQGNAGTFRQIPIYTGSTLRWNFALGNSTAEGGSNAGTDFHITRYDDAGASLGNALTVTRSTGIFAFTASPTAPTPTAGDSTTKVATTAFVDTSFAKLSGGTFTGAVVVTNNFTVSDGFIHINRAGDVLPAQLYISADAGQTRTILFQSGTSLRWQLYTDATAEAGSNAGSDLNLQTYDDSAVSLGKVFTVTRATRILAFTVSPTAPTPTAGDSSTKIATTAFVATSFAPLASPPLTGTPTAPTPTAGDSTTKIATTAFVATSFAPLASPSFSGTVLAAALTVNDGHLGIDRVGDASAALLRMYADTGNQTSFEMRTGTTDLRWKFGKLGDTEAGANAGSNFFINSYDDAGVLINQSVYIERSSGIVSFAASPTTPTPTAGDSSTKVATTAFVATSFAPLASPALTGTPTAPTPTGTDNTTKLATTAFVATNFAKLTGATFTGQVAISTTGLDSNVIVQGDAGKSRVLYYRTGASIRWALYANNVAEGGSNAGSDFTLSAYDDTGLILGNVFTVVRATRILSFIVSPTAPTPTAGDNTTKVATTAFVNASFAKLSGATFTGNIITTGGSITVNRIGGASQAIVTFGADNGFVNGLAAYIGGSAAANLRSFLRLTSVSETGSNAGSNPDLLAYDDAGAFLGSVFAVVRSTRVLTFGVSPTAPTPTAGDNTTKVATTAFVATSFAPLASPALTGVPTAPTPTAGDNTTKIATTAFVATSFAPLASPTFTGVVTLPSGSVSAPSLAIGAANDGLYRISAGNVGITAGGVQSARFNQFGIGIGSDAASGEPLSVITTVAGGIKSSGDGVISTLALRTYLTGTGGPQLNMDHYGGSIASPVAVVQNNILADISHRGATGATTIKTGFKLRTTVIAATPSETDFESQVIGLIPPPGSTTLTEIFRFEHATGFSLFGANPVINQNRHFRTRQYAAASLPAQASGDMISSSDIIAAPLVSDGTDWLTPGIVRVRTITANTTVSVPAGWAIDQIHYANTTANVVTGGMKIGTTSGATDVVAAQAIGANALDAIADANILKKVFSRTVAQTLFIQAVTSWNSASIELSIVLRKVY